MIVNAINHHDSRLNQPMTALIDPDDQGTWAVRYVWIQHTDNTQFLSNYFKDGHTKNINVRAMTTHISEDWRHHNKIFELGGKNGDLVWRVKVLNTVSNSIDYIEVWRNKELINNYFNDHDSNSMLTDGSIWVSASKKNLSREVFNTGFITRTWIPPLNISCLQAINYYTDFVTKSSKHDNCIINTKFNSTLHL